MNTRRGLTLIEVMITVAILAVLVVVAGSAFLDLMRVSKHETEILEMDQSADRALDEMTRILRPAILPIKTASGEDGGFQAIVNSVRGFESNGDNWQKLLQRGSDCLPFVVPIDIDGDGDALDADFLPELGVPDASGAPRAAGQYNAGGHLIGNIAPGLADLSPANLGLNRETGNLDLTDARFAASFRYPAAPRPPIYAVIRFAPLRENGAPVILRENEARINYDINEDGDTNDSFALGHMEVVFPGRGADVFDGESRFISTETVLLQINRNEASWEPIFKLIRYKAGDTSPNAAGPDTGLSSGDYAVKVRLLLCGDLGRQSVLTLSPRVPLLTRTFETVITLRNMAIP